MPGDLPPHSPEQSGPQPEQVPPPRPAEVRTEQGRPDYEAGLRNRGYELDTSKLNAPGSQAEQKERAATELLTYGPGASEYIKAHELAVTPPSLMHPNKEGLRVMVLASKITNFDYEDPATRKLIAGQIIVDQPGTFTVEGGNLKLITESSVPNTKDIAIFAPQSPMDPHSRLMLVEMQEDVPDAPATFDPGSLRPRGDGLGTPAE